MFERSFIMIKDAVREGVFPCAAVAIGCGNQVLSQLCFGTVSYEADAAVCTSKTLFDLASLTKVVATTPITLRLMERGVLSLDDTLSYFYDVSPNYQDIKLRHLLTHTSGIAAHFLLEEQPNGKNPVEAILSRPLVYTTGTRVEYSCMGFILLGKVLEKVTGIPLNILAQNEVFGPLSMEQTSYLPDSMFCAPTEKRPEGGYLNGIVHDENARFLGGVSGNAGVFSTLSDMIRFARMLACRGLLDKNRFLTERALKIATKNYTQGLNENRGLGFKLSGGEGNFFGDMLYNNSFGHTGFTGTSIVVEPCSGLFVILLTNRVHPTRENAAILRFRRQFYNSVADEFERQYGTESRLI